MYAELKRKAENRKEWRIWKPHGRLLTTTRRLTNALRCLTLLVIVIVIVNSKLLKRHSKAKRRAPAYSRALRQIRGVFQRIVRYEIIATPINSNKFTEFDR